MTLWRLSLNFVIPTGAYPDFLLRGLHVRLSNKKQTRFMPLWVGNAGE